MEYFKHIRAILLLPILVTIVIPFCLVYLTSSVVLAVLVPRPWRTLGVLCGFVLFGMGLFLLMTTVRLFFSVGKGTFAPWDPTRTLVIQGVYRYVRNPMILGVFSILLGEALILGSPIILGWFMVFVVGNLLYIPFVEEKDLLHRFGMEYVDYQRNVPRWIPRLTPWSKGN